MAYKNRDDALAYLWEHYAQNKKYYTQKTSRYKENTRKWFVKYKASLKCEICGESRAPCLDFHHLDEKKMNIGLMPRWGHSVETILTEIKRCQVLCANCHRMIHAF